MSRGMHVEVLRGKYHAALGGLSGRFDTLTLTGPGIPEIFEPTERAPEVVLIEPAYQGCPPRAEPVGPPDSGNVGWMAGGAYVVSLDSRWPFSGPITLLDRQESVELYNALST